MKFQALIELINANKCSGLKSIIKRYFVGYFLILNFDFNFNIVSSFLEEMACVLLLQRCFSSVLQKVFTEKFLPF